VHVEASAGLSGLPALAVGCSGAPDPKLLPLGFWGAEHASAAGRLTSGPRPEALSQWHACCAGVGAAQSSGTVESHA